MNLLLVDGSSVQILTKIEIQTQTIWKPNKNQKLKKNTRPGEANVEGIIDEHLTGGLGLRLAFLGENSEIGAPLDPSLLIPSALAVPHQHHPLRRLDHRERRRRVELRPELRPLRRLLDDLFEARRGPNWESRRSRVWIGSSGSEPGSGEEEEGRSFVDEERGHLDFCFDFFLILDPESVLFSRFLVLLKAGFSVVLYGYRCLSKKKKFKIKINK